MHMTENQKNAHDMKPAFSGKEEAEDGRLWPLPFQKMPNR